MVAGVEAKVLKVDRKGEGTCHSFHHRFSCRYRKDKPVFAVRVENIKANIVIQFKSFQFGGILSFSFCKR